MSEFIFSSLFPFSFSQINLLLSLLSSTVGQQPLRRLITPIGFGDKFLKSKLYWSFRSSLFWKGLWSRL